MHISIKHISLSLVVISILTVAVYFPSLSGGFIHDDHPNLVFNSKVQIETLDIESLITAATSSNAGTLKRPISMGSFALNYYFFGSDPFSFKLTNVILHIFTAILIFMITYQIHKAVSNNGHRQNNSTYWFASIVTLIWLVHPLHVSTVAYAVQRMAILSALFSLLAILFYTIGRTKIIANASSGTVHFILCVFSALLGVYSKENAALTPIFIILIEVIIFYPQTNSETYKKFSRFSISIITILIVTLLLIFRNDLNAFLSDWYNTTREFTISERLYTQARVIIYYIKWLVFPNIQELGLFHDDIPLSQSIISPITTLLSIVTIGILIITAIRIRKAYPLISLGISWFFIGHLLESTIIPLEMTYEHRNYLPSIGLILAATNLAGNAIDNKAKLKHYSSTFVVVLLTILSLITLTRAGQWSAPISFAYFEARHHPNSLRATHTLGMEYKGMTEAGYTEYKDKAYMYLEKASELGEERLFSEAALLRLAYKLNEPAKPVWIDRMAYKLSTLVPRIDDISLLKGVTECTNETCLLPNDAAQVLFNAIESNPKLKINKRNHSLYHSARANFILQRGKDPLDAENHLIKAIELNPDDIQSYADYVNLLLALNRPKEARTYVYKAKERNSIYEYIPQLVELNRKVNLALQKSAKT